MPSAEFMLDMVDTNNQSILPNVIFNSFDYSRSFSSIGSATVKIPPLYNDSYFERDSLLKLYRKANGGGPVLEAGAVWFVREKEVDLLSGEITLKCVDQNDLLRRRLVGYRSETILADHTDIDGGGGAADDLMKAYVKENMGEDALVAPLPGGADTDRDMRPYLTVEADKTLGPYVEEAASFKGIIDTLMSLRNKASALGTEVFFDVSARSDGSFDFRTHIGSLGTQRQTLANGLMFSTESGNLTKATLTWDWSGEITYVYLGRGGNSNSSKLIKVEGDAVAATPWNRIETYISAEENEDSALEDQGRGIIQGAIPKIRIAAQTVDTADTIYGLHYFYGDSVYVSARGYLFECHISSIRNKIADGADSPVVSLVGELPLVQIP